jgi:hypothetical protein
VPLQWQMLAPTKLSMTSPVASSVTTTATLNSVLSAQQSPVGPSSIFSWAKEPAPQPPALQGQAIERQNSWASQVSAPDCEIFLDPFFELYTEVVPMKMDSGFSTNQSNYDSQTRCRELSSDSKFILDSLLNDSSPSTPREVSAI